MGIGLTLLIVCRWLIAGQVMVDEFGYAERVWGMDWTDGGFGYRSDQDDGNGISEMFGHDRSPLQRTRSFPIYGNMTRVRDDRDATGWWDSIDRQSGHTITSWELFKGEFERKYFPPEAKHQLERQFMNPVQGDRPVRSYESAFTRLRRHVFDGRKDEATLIGNFAYGLKPEIGSRLAGSNFSSLSELVEKAVNVETVLEA
ncbi:hypothetical protein F2Q69_00013532 [Brassica cretica]|uniref:Retrotransposon gag domain-containing protein n=1 Tax=Brassica cretica TaxID=69181 RepID=A0A8S9QUU9_BRACR|nr:hypothetical protein F2Q69_00013532 [Brassica cretica]